MTVGDVLNVGHGPIYELISCLFKPYSLKYKHLIYTFAEFSYIDKYK